MLLTRKSLARRVYATILNASTNTDGYKEQGGCWREWAPRPAGAAGGVLRPGPSHRRDLPLRGGPEAAVVLHV